MLGGSDSNNCPASGTGANGSQGAAARALVVDLVLLERTPKQLKFQVRINNTGDRAVLIVSEPVRIDGSPGAYLSLGDTGLLETKFMVFRLLAIRYMHRKTA